MATKWLSHPEVLPSFLWSSHGWQTNNNKYFPQLLFFDNILLDEHPPICSSPNQIKWLYKRPNMSLQISYNPFTIMLEIFLPKKRRKNRDILVSSHGQL